jgi:hypothetical protein
MNTHEYWIEIFANLEKQPIFCLIFLDRQRAILVQIDFNAKPFSHIKMIEYKSLMNKLAEFKSP